MSRSKPVRRAILAVTRRIELSTLLDVLGVAAVVAGVALVYIPAALVVFGAALLAASYATHPALDPNRKPGAP